MESDKLTHCSPVTPAQTSTAHPATPALRTHMAPPAALEVATTLDHRETPTPMAQAIRTPQTHMAAPAAPEEVTTMAHQVTLILLVPLETPTPTMQAIRTPKTHMAP